MLLLFLPCRDAAGRRCSQWGCSGWGASSPWLGGTGTMAAWAQWHCGHHGTMAASATRWHCMAWHKAPCPLGQILGWAKLWAMPAPWPSVPDRTLCQILGHAKPGAVPDCEPCQITSVPNWGPQQVMSCAEVRIMPDWEPDRIPCRTSPFWLGPQPRHKSPTTLALQPRPLCLCHPLRLPPLWGLSWKWLCHVGKFLDEKTKILCTFSDSWEAIHYFIAIEGLEMPHRGDTKLAPQARPRQRWAVLIGDSGR